MKNPFVSVIIPNYCHSKYLDQRIQSVLNQTYQNFEVIILDDCSPDEGASKAIIEKYRSNEHVAHIVYNDVNSGSTFNQWNTGIELAKGEIIWIAESDDYCNLDFLERIIPCWQLYPTCNIVETSICEVDENGVDISPKRLYDHTSVFYNGIKFIKGYLINSNYHIPNASAVTFRKSAAMCINRDYISYKASGDRLFWIYLLEIGDICKIFSPLSYFRQHNIKVTQKKEYDGTQARENYKINQYLHSKGYIRGELIFEEYLFYYIYFKMHTFETPKIKMELKKLWFPWWCRSYFSFKIIQLFFSMYKYLKRFKIFYGDSSYNR